MTSLLWGVCTTAGLQPLPWRSQLLLQEMTAGMVINRKLKNSLKGGRKPNSLPFHFQWHNPQSMLTIFLYCPPPKKKFDILFLCIKVNALSLWCNRCLTRQFVTLVKDCVVQKLKIESCWNCQALFFFQVHSNFSPQVSKSFKTKIVFCIWDSVLLLSLSLSQHTHPHSSTHTQTLSWWERKFHSNLVHQKFTDPSLLRMLQKWRQALQQLLLNPPCGL